MNVNTPQSEEVVKIIVDTMKRCNSELDYQRRKFNVDVSGVAELGKAVAELGKAYARFMAVSPDD